MFLREKTTLPGFRVAFSTTLVYLAILVLFPLGVMIVKSFSLGWHNFAMHAFSERSLAALRLSLKSAFLAAAIDLVVGLLIAWVLVRHNFWGKRFFDALIDLPFALPTAVAGIALATLYSETGFVGSLFAQFGFSVTNNGSGIVLALVFIGLPFVVRTVEPVLEDFEKETEEAARSLGASRAQTFFRVILPSLFPALFAGATMAFSRALGEYGSVIFIAGNIPFVSEIVPLVIVTKLEAHDLQGATALAVFMLAVSFTLLLLLNLLQSRYRKRRS